MTQNVRFGLLAIALLFIVWLMTQMSLIKDENLKLEKQLISMQSDAAHYANLKKRWDKTDQKKHLLKKLSTIKAFDKRFIKGGNEVVVYNQLYSKMLDRISYAIFSSDVHIVDLLIEKTSNGVTLKVELK